MRNKSFYKSLFDNYSKFEESTLKTKFIEFETLESMVNRFLNDGLQVEKRGVSIENRPIYSIKIGTGKIKVLAWSQMHGDESTATMAIFDVLNFFSDSDKFDKLRLKILSELTIYFIPMLNPDGAISFTRENAAGIDLNRDALRLSTPEAKILMSAFHKIKPDFAFNLHDQDGRYSVGKSKKPAIISFLAPPFNFKKEINTVRANTMKLISNIFQTLNEYIPGNIAKYTDEHEPRSFGDNFVKLGTSSVLIESGGPKLGDNKQLQRKLNFIAIIAGLFSISTKNYEQFSVEDYQNIPENEKLMFDVLLKNLNYCVGKNNFNIDIGIIISENRDSKTNSFYYESKIEEIGDLNRFGGYAELDLKGMSIEPGKISKKYFPYNEIFTDERLYEFYSQGITCLKTEFIDPELIYNNFGINIISNPTFKNKIQINSPANLIISVGNEIVYVVINGFVFDLKQKTGQIKNGLIIR